MAVSPILEIQEVAPTQTDKTTTMNDMIVNIEAAENDQLSVSLAGGNVTLSFTQFSRHKVFKCSGLTAARNLIIPLITPTGSLPALRVFSVRNTSAFALTVGGLTGSVVVVAAGTGAEVSSDGVNCLTYVAGGPGPAGPAGGGVSMNTTFDTGITNADPGSGLIRLNNATANLATAIYLDVLDDGATDWTSVLDTLDGSTSTTSKGQIRLFKRSDPHSWILFRLTARIAHTGYREFTVVVTGSSGANPFIAADQLSFSFTRTGDLGNTGATGATGPIGPTGLTGIAGGGISIPYNFDTSTTNADPGSGNLRLNNATANLATAIYVDLLGSGGTDWTTVLDTLDASSSIVKGQIRLFDRTDLTKWIVFNVTGRTTHTGYREFAVTVLGSSTASPFVAAEALMLAFSRTGDVGLAGGGISLGYNFDTTVTNADPGNGNIRLNNATENLATAIYADLLDSAGSDWTAVLDTLDASTSVVKGQLRLFDRADPTKWIVFNLTGRTTHVGYREFAVTVLGSSAASPFIAAEALILVFTRTGDVGTGAPGGSTNDVQINNGSATFAGLTLNAGQVLVGHGSGAAPDIVTLGSQSFVTTSGTLAARPAARAQVQWVTGATVTADTIYFIYDAPYSGTINSLTYFTGAGSFTVNVQINGVSVTGLGAVLVNSATPATTNATAANTFAAGDKITGVITGVSGTAPIDALLSLKATWDR